VENFNINSQVFWFHK